MSGYLARLAGLALGTPAPGAARLSLPPRFAPPAADELATDAAPEVPVERDEAGAAVGADPAPGPALPRRSEAGASASEALERPDAPVGPARVPLAAAASPPAAVPPPAAAAPLPAAAASPAPRLAEGPAAEQPPDPTPSRPLPRAKASRQPLPPLSAPRRNEAHVAGPAPQRPPPPLQTVASPPSDAPETRSAPLSDRAIAGRAQPRRQPPPVIQVTIDRIDVRSPAAPAPPPPIARRPRPEPSVSLADFLRAGTRTPR